MKRYPLSACLCLVIGAGQADRTACSTPADASPRGPTLCTVDFAARFGDLDGCFVLAPVDGAWTIRYRDERCGRRLAPCSTFKIFNTLAALDSGVLTGPDHLLKWDGRRKYRKACERDHTLTTAICHSVLWYFQEVAERVGRKRMKKYLDACDYGSRGPCDAIRQFWLDGSLTVSADEQVRFLQRLYRNDLPFKPEATDTVRRLLVEAAGIDQPAATRGVPQITVSGKTGSALTDGRGTLGWFVGHVSDGGRQYVFAVNVLGEDGASGHVARAIALEILQDLGLWSSAPPPEAP